MENKLTKYLIEYKGEIENYFKTRKHTNENFIFFQSFLKEENLNRLNNLISTESSDWEVNKVWIELKKIRNKIHSFKTPALSGGRALGSFPNHPLERYINLFLYLCYGEEDKEKRVLKILNREGEYNIYGFALSSLSEVVAQAFPDDYVFYNKRNKTAVEFLDINLNLVGGVSDGDEFLRYNKSLQTVIQEYSKIIYQEKEPEYFVYNRNELFSKTSIPHEVDQFFNWLYENKIFSEEKNKVKIYEPIGKVSKIIFNDFLLFKKDLEIDLTYPEGHEKAGQPLDKVCIIGQSGTGKTTLLNIIKAFTSLNKKNLPNIFKNSIEVYFKYDKFELVTKPSENDDLICEVIKKGNKKSLKDYSPEPRLIYFPVYSVENLAKYIEKKEDVFSKPNINLDLYIDFTDEQQSDRIWNKILEDINKYRKEQFDVAIRTNKRILNNDNIDQLINELQNLKGKGINPLIKLANFLNPFIKNFNLEVKTIIDELNYENLNFPEFVNIQDNDNKVIPSKALSTGTKQILSKSIPLYELMPYHSIILIDEPENSLYPDIQKKFVKFLTEETWLNLEKNEKTEKSCQFFFATHSPTIASNFEPWEIVELKFNDEGKICQEDYRKDTSKPRNENNYKFYPKYLRWDSIFTKIFDIEYEGSEERAELLAELGYLDEKINYLNEQKKQPELNKVVEEYKKIAEKLAWKINENL